MQDNTPTYIEELNTLNELIQDWTDKPDQNGNTSSEFILEFDLVINQLRQLATNSSDYDLDHICEHYQKNLIIFYESKISSTQMELICAWPIYIDEFLLHRDSTEVKKSLEEFLCDKNWPSTYSINDISSAPSNVDIILDETEIFVSTDKSTSIDDSGDDNTDNLTSEQRELLELINAEVVEIQMMHIERLTQLVNSSDISHEVLCEEVDTQIDQLNRIGSAADMIGLHGLKKYCKHLQKIVDQLQNLDRKQLVELLDQLMIWPEIIQTYLLAPQDSGCILAALDYLNLDSWPIQLKSVEHKNMEDAFFSSKVEVDSSQIPERINEATEESVSLNKPEDVAEELFDSLLQDLPEQTAEFSFAVQKLTGHDYLEQLEVSKRIAHTLKGAGNTVGIQGLANLTHHIEDILDALLNDRAKPTQQLHSVIEDAADYLEEMSEFLHGIGSEPKEAIPILQAIINWANYIDEHGVPSASNIALPGHDVSTTANTQDSDFQNNSSERDVPTDQSIRVATRLIDDLLKRAGENINSNAQIQEFVLRTKNYAKQLHTNNNRIKTLVSELEHLIEVRGFSSRFSSNNKLGIFDPLEMDQLNELNTYTNLLIEAAADSNEFVSNIQESVLRLENISNNQGRILIENQEAVLRTRMVPVKSILQRLKRAVKQANKLSNKQVQLNITGDDVLIDSDILNQLADPLMHILRNAVDHGIEQPEIREKLGKNENGSIELSFLKKGKLINIRCKDDGRGLDIDRIKSRGLELGLIQESEEFNKENALKLVLQHGFSTKEEVSQLSGRGVGLDVVLAEVRDLKGSVLIDSDSGQGTKIELTVPTTFYSTQALLGTYANNMLAISSRGIEEILHPGAGKIISLNGQSHFAYKQKRYPIFDLQNSLFNEYSNETEDPSQAVLITKDDFNKSYAILIDKILDSREITIEPFSRYIPKMSGLIGTTILGDGSVTTVIDLLDIVNASDSSVLKSRNKIQKQTSQDKEQHALIVEDAISTRKSLAQFMMDLGYKVDTAKDGVEAIDIIQKQLPSIILTDLEMPRMNGLEFTDHLRSNEETKYIPIIMITSRATDKHKKEAKRVGVTEYMTKPFDEDKLLHLLKKVSTVI